MRRTKIASFPQHYRVDLDAAGHLSAGPRPAITGGPPEQFGGDDRSWGPESLLVAAVALDHQTTVRQLAQEAGIVLHGYRCVADGTLSKKASGLALQVILLTVDIFVEEAERERAQLLAQRAKQFCVVAGALRCPVELELIVHAGQFHPPLESVASLTPPGWPAGTEGGEPASAGEGGRGEEPERAEDSDRAASLGDGASTQS